MPFANIEDKRKWNREYARKWRAANPEKVKEITRRSYQRNPEKMKEQGRLWHKNNPEKSKEQRRRWRNRNKEKRQEHQLKAKYGISRADKLRMINAQASKCKICCMSIDMETGCIDHLHNPFRLRDILCDSCNKLLGFAKENISTLESAIDYLKRHSLIQNVLLETECRPRMTLN